MENLTVNELPAAKWLKFPMGLITNPKYDEISYGAKFLYMIMLNRMNLSIANSDRFSDKEGLFIYFRQSEIAKIMGCSERWARAFMGELKTIGLIVVEPQGKKRPAKIRLKPVEITDNPTNGMFITDDSAEEYGESDRNNPSAHSPSDRNDTSAQNKSDRNNPSAPYEKDLHIEKDLHSYISPNDEKKPKKPRFMKPTIEEVQQYINEKNYHFDAEEFWNHYENCEWEIGRTGKKMKNWKLACRTWENNQLRFNKRNNSKRSPIAPPRPNKNEGFHVEEM